MVSLSPPELAALMTRRRGGLNFVFASFACNQKPRFCQKRGFFLMMMADTATGSFQLRMLITGFSIPDVWKI